MSQLVIVVTPLQLLFDKTQLFGKFGPATQFQCFIVISFALFKRYVDGGSKLKPENHILCERLGQFMIFMIGTWPRTIFREFMTFSHKKEKNGPNRQFPFQCKWQRPPFAISAPGRKQYFLSIRLNLFLTIFKADFKYIFKSALLYFVQ